MTPHDAAMRRLLFISPHFPPDSSAGTHRARLLAPRLAEHGWDATVLTVDPSAYEGALDPALAASVPSALRVVRARAWPAGVTRRLGLGDLGLRALTGLRREAHRLLAGERFDALFITTYPIYPAALGPRLKRRFAVPFVLDYQDPWVGAWGLSVGGGPGGAADLKSRASRAAAARLEPIVLGAADGVTGVSAATYADALERNHIPPPAAVAELPIGWDQRDIEFLAGRSPRQRPLAPRADGLVHLAYVGTLLPTGLDTLRALCRAWAEWRARDPASASRLRVHFIGTSNQREATVLRALPIARELGVGDLVSEHPARLDYFDALQALRDADGVLLMGSHERHYTPSKLYPAMLSERPLVALFHAASTATAMLRRFGAAPSVRLIAFDDQRPIEAHVDDIAAQLCAFVRCPGFDAHAVDRRVLDDASAPVLAGRLAALLDRVAR
jgi:glycosyltransferase involved in cell wall biosynthesis